MKTKEEIEQLAAREYWNTNTESRSFIRGYTQCQEDMADKKYTEEDMIKCWEYASIDKHQIFGDQIGEHYLSFIKSLNKQD